MSDLGYSNAFKQLGYKLDSVRQDWSAETPEGVCISLWSKEMRYLKGVPFMDTEIDCELIEEWADKSGAVKRKAHLASAWNNHDRWVDVVVRQGEPGQTGVPSEAWVVPKRKKYKWRLQTFDAETGHFSAKPEQI